MKLSFPTAIQFVLSDEFSHLRPEQRLALLHVSNAKFDCQLVLPYVTYLYFMFLSLSLVHSCHFRKELVHVSFQLLWKLFLTTLIIGCR